MFAILSFKWELNTFVFYTRINSITAHKLSAIVSRILNKTEALISGRFLRLCGSSLLIFDEHFMTLFSVRYF